jgi:hypothetical protein
MLKICIQAVTINTREYVKAPQLKCPSIGIGRQKGYVYKEWQVSSATCRTATPHISLVYE